MSSTNPAAEYGAFGTFIERIGIPRPLFWGYVAVFLFMIGDGVESNYLAPYIAGQHGFNEQIAGTVISIYGGAVAIGSWFSGTLSTVWGPRRVMWLGGAIWIVFEILFLAVALPSNSYFLIGLFYGLRGFAYPLFAYGFLVWIQTIAVTHMRATSAGWFWFCFTGGLPTLGSVVAAISIGPLSEYLTFWVSLVIVTIGALIGAFAVREAHGTRPIVDETNPQAVENPTSYKRLFEGIDILWRDPRVTVGGIVRIINTAPEFGFFVFFPFVFTRVVGLSQGQYLTLIAITFAVNIIGNVSFGFIGDKVGWRRTNTFFGSIGCMIATLLFYFVPVAVGDVYWVSIVVGMLYGFLLAGYVPLSAIMPAMVPPKDKGNAMAVLNFGAGTAAFVGPAIFTVLNPFIGTAGVVIVYAALYGVNAVLSWVFVRDASDPAEQRKRAAEEVGAATE